MAARFWVGGTGNWDATTTTNWSATTGGAGGASVPGSADDVTFDVSSGAGTVTLTALASVNTVNMTSTGSVNLTLNAALNVAGVLTHGHLTLNTNGQTCQWGSFNGSFSATRTLTMGNSTITLTTGGAAAWNMATTTTLTITANTATLIFSGPGSTMAGSPNLNGASLVFTGSGAGIIGSIPSGLANITRTGTAVTTDSLQLNVGGIAISGVLTVNGNSAKNRLLVASNSVGTARSISAAGGIVASYVDFADITNTGTTWNLATITGGSGNVGGNSGITFTTPAAQTWQGTAGGSWSDVTKWSSRVPLPQDDMSIASAFAAAQTITVDMPRLGRDLNFTGSTGNVTFLLTTGLATSVYGSVTFVAGGPGSLVGTNIFTLAGRGSNTISTAASFWFVGTIIDCATGTYKLLTPISIGGTTAHRSGTFDVNGQTLALGAFNSNTAATRAILGVAGLTITLNPTGTTAWLVTATGLTADFSTTTFKFAVGPGGTQNQRVFGGGGFTYGTLDFTPTAFSGIGALLVSGNNTFDQINTNPGKTVTFTAGSRNAVRVRNMVGQSNGYQRFPALAANYASTPDAAPLRITGDIDIMVRLSNDSWAVTGPLVAKYVENTGLRGYTIFMDVTTKKMRFYASTDGTTASFVTSSAAVPIADGAVGWIRVTRVAATGVNTFYTSSTNTNDPTAVVWTQLGTTVTGVTGAIFNVPSEFSVGHYNNGVGTTLPAGNFYRVRVLSGIGGTIAFDADFTAKAFGANSFTESSANAATVTINGPYAQSGDGRVAVNSSTPGTPAILASSQLLAMGAHSVDVSGNSGLFFTSGPDMDYLVVQDIAGGVANLSGAGTLTAPGIPGPVVPAGLSGSGRLDSSGATPNISGIATLGGSGALSTSDTPSIPGIGTFSGAGTLDAPGVPAIASADTFSGSGTLTSSAVSNFGQSVVLSGIGTLITIAVPHLVKAATLSGLGTLAVLGVPAVVLPTALSGDGVLIAVGVRFIIPRDLELNYEIGTDRWSEIIGIERWASAAGSDRWTSTVEKP